MELTDNYRVCKGLRDEIEVCSNISDIAVVVWLRR